jgi:hypothetical protein
VPEDCANRKRILPGFQGYIALKRKTTKQLATEEYFLKFFAAAAERKSLAKRRLYRLSRRCPFQVFATVTVYTVSALTGSHLCQAGRVGRQAVTIVTAIGAITARRGRALDADTIIHHTGTPVVF